MRERKRSGRSRARQGEEEARIREVFEALGGSPERVEPEAPPSDRSETLPQRIEAQVSRQRSTEPLIDGERNMSGPDSTPDRPAQSPPVTSTALDDLAIGDPAGSCGRPEPRAVARYATVAPEVQISPQAAPRPRWRPHAEKSSWPSTVAWFWIASAWGTASTVGVALGADASYRAPVVLSFLLVCPGFAIVRLLGIPAPRFQLSLAVAISMALDVLVPAALLYAGGWSPLAALAILATLTNVAAVAELAFGTVNWLGDSSSRRRAVDHGISVGVDPDESFGVSD